LVIKQCRSRIEFEHLVEHGWGRERDIWKGFLKAGCHRGS
jgi:hypothetical protein